MGEPEPPRGVRSRGPIAVDLYSGCGGLTLGLKQAGFKVIGAVDVDPLAAETYSLNHPEVRMWQADIRGVSARRISVNNRRSTPGFC